MTGSQNYYDMHLHVSQDKLVVGPVTPGVDTYDPTFCIPTGLLVMQVAVRASHSSINSCTNSSHVSQLHHTGRTQSMHIPIRIKRANTHSCHSW
jgi:hypothetical protein